MVAVRTPRKTSKSTLGFHAASESGQGRDVVIQLRVIQKIQFLINTHYRSTATIRRNLLNQLLARLTAGTQVTSEELSDLGISAESPRFWRVSEVENNHAAPLVSSPERALLELLSEVGVRQSLSEARELTEGTHTLRSSVLVQLLKKCTNVKTVRLCLTLGRELSLPWASKLDPKALPTGSDKPWVSRSR